MAPGGRRAPGPAVRVTTGRTTEGWACHDPPSPRTSSPTGPHTRSRPVPGTVGVTGRCVKTDIRLSRLSGGTHLSWMVDELDLPWLLHVIQELDVEDDAIVSLADPDGDGQLVVRVREQGFAVERSAAGAHAQLARLTTGEAGEGGNGGEGGASSTPDPATAPAGGAVDFDTVREVVAAFLQDRQPAGDLRWIARGHG